MSQIVPVMHREPVVPEKRKPLTKAQRREILARQDDNCGECGTSLIWRVEAGQKIYGPMIDEHVKRLFVGGSNELRNRQLWCVGCSKAKTKAEAPQNAKVRRILQWGEDERPSRLQGRGFPKHLTKSVNGAVKPRKQRLNASQNLSEPREGGSMPPNHKNKPGATP